MPRHRCASVLALALCVSTAAFGDTLNLGFLSFDVLIPGEPGNPGVNVFNIANFTGDPSLGGFALPPDFPAFSALTFIGSSLTLPDGGSPVTVPLGLIAPGPITPPSALQFPDTTLFSSALFAATLSRTSFLLSDGSTFIVDSPALNTTLLPSGGSSLTAGSDFAIIAVTGTVSAIPEPGSLALIASALAVFFVRTRWHRA